MNDNAINYLEDLILQQKVRTSMAILGLILSIFVAVSSVVLLVIVEDDTLTSITGVVFLILGSMLCGFYSAMLMGW